jgi:hypothetical protein
MNSDRRRSDELTSLDSWPDEEGIREEATAAAIERVIAYAAEAELEQRGDS